MEVILLKGKLYDGGVNITEFNMESAKTINTGLAHANLVEECACPEGYDGLSCEVSITYIIYLLFV